MTQKSMIADDETSGKPIYVREGDKKAWSIPVAGVVTGITNDATLVQYFYKEGAQNDTLSATYWTGSMSVSGVNTVITKRLTGVQKAGNYILSIFGTLDGEEQNIVTIPFIIKRKSDR